MKIWQKILLIAAILALTTVTVLTWGSLGSAATLMCMITMCSAFLFQKYVTNRDNDQFDTE